MKTVLVIDDEPAIVESLSDLLEEEGFRVVSADNGREGLAVASRSRPDLILLDVMMPVLDGRRTLRRLKETAALAATPVILMSAASIAANSSERQMASFLRKPFELNDLLELIRKLLGHRKPR